MEKTNEFNKQVGNPVGATIGRPLLQRLGLNKGITLVALIITIVIMLILATVTVNVVIDGGLFEYARNAKDSVEVASEKETIQKAFIFAESASKTGRITKAELQKSINKVMSEDNATVYDFDEDFVIIFGTKRAYTIDKKGKILGMEENYKSPNKTFLAQVSDNNYGTEEKPYEIKCIEDLVDLSYAVNGIEVLEDGTISYTATVNDFEEKYISLIQNINFTSELSYENAERTDYGDINGNEKVEELLTELTTGTGWLPIGNAVKSGSCFFGIFNGKGKKISSLYINNAEETNYSGLFGNTRDGEIINLAVSGDIYCNSLYAGGIVGYPYAWNKTYIIDNCSFNGKIENINTGDHGFVGGLVGTPAGALDVTNSYNEATVIGKKNSGGISGSGGRNFINCHNKGDVKGENYVGGITSNNAIFIEGCTNTGKIVSLGYSSGGILGYWYYGTTNIINCINYGDIEVTRFGGGILGSNMAGTSYIYNCGNYGMVSVKNSIDTSSSKSIGGICGNTGNGSGGGDKGIIANCYNLGIIRDANRVGGILGAHDVGSVLIENVMNLNNISNGTTSYGAIVGNNNNSTTLNNAFYLTGTADKGKPGNTDTSIPFEKSNIQNIISNLNKYIVDNNKEDYLVWSYDEKENKINFTEPNE